MKQKKYGLFLAAAALAALVCLGSWLFISHVSAQLWQNSVNTITESTQQGANALRLQLRGDYEILRRIGVRIGVVSTDQAGQTEDTLRLYGAVEPSMSVYLASGAELSGMAEHDQRVAEALSAAPGEEGLLAPHISSVTGRNVFNSYIKASFADGTDCYVVKEYGVDETADQFTLSFYNNTGFSYLVDREGEVLIRSSHVNSNKTLQNLFDMLPLAENDPAVVEQFRQSLRNSRTGWARFQYSGEPTVFCYTPLLEGSDWYLVSIVPESVITAQTRQILFQALILLGTVLLGIALILAFYLCSVRKNRRKLENQAAFITHLYNSVPEGIALISVEEPYRIVRLNREGHRLLGSPDSDPAGVPQIPAGISLEPAEKESAWAQFRAAAADGGKHSIANRVVRADGSCFWISGIVERISDMDGAPILIATFQDITLEKLAEEEREREKLMERRSLISAISSAYPMIMSLNLTRDELNILYSSPAMRLDLLDVHTCTDAFRSYEAALHPDALPEYRERFSPQRILQRLGSELGEIFLEARARLSDGAYHWVSVQILSVENPFSEDCTAILLARCVDEQKHDEAQSRQALQTALDAANAASQAKGQFLSNMSHDIRTPLNAILGMTAIAENHLTEPKRLADCLRKIELSGTHLLSLVNDVLDMSKIESGKLSLSEEPLRLSALFADVVELVAPQARDGGLTLETAPVLLKDERVMGDPLRIRQVLLNVISNAVKYTPQGGAVRLELTQAESLREGYGSYRFRCADTGIGMEPEFLDKLFLPFERSQSSTASKITGTGLGMAITKNILDMMGGTIRVESAPGVGSTFTVTVPLRLQPPAAAQESAAPAAAAAPRPDETPDLHGKRLLLVEDNALNLEIARELIGLTGIEIDEARDGAEAVRTVADAPPGHYDLVLMDVQMPVMDGYEATRQIRRLDRPGVLTLPIIAMTANAFSEDIEAARRSGMNGHISKPIDLGVVHRVLRQWLLGET